MEPLQIIVDYWNPVPYILPILGALLIIFIGKNDLFEKIEQGVFVRINEVVADAAIYLSELFFRVFEVGVMVGIINKGIPFVFISLYHRVKKVQTGILSYNILYIIILLVLMILLLILGGA
jgi:hypothetical protein